MRPRGGQGPATEPSHRVDRVQRRGQEEAQPQSSATEFTRAASECGQLFSFLRATEPSQQPRRVDRVQGRGQEKDNRRVRPGHRARRAKRTRGGQEEDRAWDKRRTRPSHRVDRVQRRGQEEDKRRRRRSHKPSHRAEPQS